MSLQYTSNRLQNAEKRIDKFIDDNLVDWVEQEILKPTQKLAIQEGLSDNAANSMKVIKNGYLKAKLIWDYRGPNDEPLSLWLEKGTRSHIIRALGKLFGGSDFLSWIDKAGKRLFRREVKHPGTKGKKIMERGYKQNKNQLKRRVIEETNNFLQVSKL